MRDRLGRWRHGQYGQLWDEAVNTNKLRGRGRRKTAQQEPSQEEKNVKRATRLAQEGQYTRAMQSLLSGGMAENTRDTVREMKAKHPAGRHATNLQPEPSTPQMIFSQRQVVKEIKSFRKGTAPGPSGLRAEHLKVSIKSAPPNRTDKATEAITKLVNTMAGGRVPEQVAPFLAGARLHTAVKKDGGLRPIAVGEITRRLTSKCFNSATFERAANILSPHQLGVGVRGGCEALAHTMRQVVEEAQDNQDIHILQVDLVNAYNMADRETTFKEVEKHFPDCLAWVQTCYGVESELIFGDTIILSSVGFHQGDPLAGLLFSLNLHPVITKIGEEVPNLKLNEWYLDDGDLAGTKESLTQAVDIIKQEGPPRGLYLSTRKSTVWCPSNPNGMEDPLNRGIPSIRENGITILGSPVGSPQFIRERIQSKVDKIREITNKLPLLQDAHTEFVLLRSCLSMPKVMYILRTTDPTTHQDIWKEFDNLTREALTKILGPSVNNIQWAQALLPVSMTGLGLRSAEDHGPAAYATSRLSSHSLLLEILQRTEEDNPVNLPLALLTLLSAKLDENEETSTVSLQGMSQKAVSLKIDLHNFSLLTNHFTREENKREIARLASLGLPHAGDWLYVVPSPVLGLHLRSREFSVSVRYRLGCPVYPTAGACPACSRLSDTAGDHAISCGSEGERIARHNHLRDVLFHTAVSAALAPSREDRALLPGTDARPADVMIPHWTGGRDTALDVTVINPLQSSLVALAATSPGHALTVAYNRKMTNTGAACQREGITFIPLPVETLGGWHEAAILQVTKLGTALARQTGLEESVEVSRLFQRLSLLLVKGNSALFLNRNPSFPDPTTDGEL